MSSQSAPSARGTNSDSVFTRSAGPAASSLMRYLSSPNSLGAIDTMGSRLPGLIEAGRSVILPLLRNFGDHPAYGPNSRPGLWLMTRVSRCGTDIGGAPTAACP